MNYIVYKTTNILNGKIYIGVHNNKDDNYIGSGTALKQAIKKYGKTNFFRETLYSNLSKEEAYQIESNIVNEKFINRTDTYNMMTGGFGSDGSALRGKKDPNIVNG